VLGDFNEWMKGLATAMLSERLQSIDLRSHLRRRRTYPGILPVLHLDHIYYDGQVEVVKLELPRTRLSLMASDHLPLVADLKIRFR
jgi:endonuclease/exonuclease/phosphatase family metal-dependent hydrolase